MKVNFYEYGKYFMAEGASDFCVLAYSDPVFIDKDSNMIKPDVMYRSLYFREKTRIANEVGAVSLAFLPSLNGWSLVHVQRRKEDEKLISDHRRSDIVSRPYYQFRVYLIDLKQLKFSYRAGRSILYNCIFNHNKVKEIPRLADYFEKETQSIEMKINAEVISHSFLYKMLNPSFSKKALVKAQNILFSIVCALLSVNKQKTVCVICGGMPQSDRLSLAEDIERLVYWKRRKFISFALDIFIAPAGGVDLLFCGGYDEIPADIIVNGILIDIENVPSLDMDTTVILQEFQRITNSDLQVTGKWEKLNNIFFVQLPVVRDIKVAASSDYLEKILYLLKLPTTVMLDNIGNDNYSEVFGDLEKCFLYYCSQLTIYQRNGLLTELKNLLSEHMLSDDSNFFVGFETFFRAYFVSVPDVFDYSLDLKFFISNIPILTKDKALGYLVNKNIDRAPVDSYWSVALDVMREEKKANPFFVHILKLSLESSHGLLGVAFIDVEKIDSLAKTDETAKGVLRDLVNKLLYPPLSNWGLAVNFSSIVFEKKSLLRDSVLSDEVWSDYCGKYYGDKQEIVGNVYDPSFDEATYEDSRNKISLNILQKMIENSQEIIVDFTKALEIFNEIILLANNAELPFRAQPENSLQEKLSSGISHKELGKMLESFYRALIFTVENESIFTSVRFLKIIVPFIYIFVATIDSGRKRYPFITSSLDEFLSWLLYEFYPAFVVRAQSSFVSYDLVLTLTGSGDGRLDKVLNFGNQTLDLCACENINVSLWLVYTYAQMHHWEIDSDLDMRLYQCRKNNPFAKIRKPFRLWFNFLYES